MVIVWMLPKGVAMHLAVGRREGWILLFLTRLRAQGTAAACVVVMCTHLRRLHHRRHSVQPGVGGKLLQLVDGRDDINVSTLARRVGWFGDSRRSARSKSCMYIYKTTLKKTLSPCSLSLIILATSRIWQEEDPKCWLDRSAALIHRVTSVLAGSTN